jgi:hypothetical protein
MIFTFNVHYSFRHYIGIFREEKLLNRLSSLLSFVKTHNFEIVSLEPHRKDGGVFVRFRYSADNSMSALDIIHESAREVAAERGGIPSWIELARGDVWLVRGKPWREVCLIIYNSNFSILNLLVWIRT